jgi:galactose mutarotase-like enzyme
MSDSKPLAPPRLFPEKRTLLSTEVLSLETTTQGAIVRSISVRGRLITRDIDPKPTAEGEKGGLFCCPVLFARFPDRTLRFGGSAYTLEYPDDIDAARVDPNRLFPHGYEHFYSWEVEREDSEKVRYVLPWERQPSNFPFPHDSFIQYRIADQRTLEITVGVTAREKPVPAMLTIHPMFRFHITEGDSGPSCSVKLSHKFDYPPEAPQPMSDKAPIELADGGPFASGATLPKNLDHSFLADAISRISWPSGPTLEMEDKTADQVLSIKPLQIWTTGADTRNTFGVEHGGPANIFNLVADKAVPDRWLAVAKPFQSISRVVEYRFL